MSSLIGISADDWIRCLVDLTRIQWGNHIIPDKTTWISTYPMSPSTSLPLTPFAPTLGVIGDSNTKCINLPSSLSSDQSAKRGEIGSRCEVADDCMYGSCTGNVCVAPALLCPSNSTGWYLFPSLSLSFLPIPTTSTTQILRIEWTSQWLFYDFLHPFNEMAVKCHKILLLGDQSACITSLPYYTSPHLISPHLISSHLTLPYLTLPYLTLPYLTLPYLT